MTAPVQENSDARDIAGLNWRVGQLARRPGVRPQAGFFIFEIKVFEDDVEVVERDWKFDIPVEADESTLTDVEAWVTGVSSSGTITVQIRNETQGVDMLSTPMTIDVGEKNDDDAGTPFTINLANAEVAYKDEIWVRVISAGSGALGLGVKLAFTPADTAAIAIRGAKGDPGGVTDFQGAWQNGTTYQAGDVVTNNNVVYVSTQDHTSNAANDEPGVGTNQGDFWIPMADVPLVASLNISIHSSSGAVPDSTYEVVQMPFDATLTGVTVLADQATDAVIDIWKTDYAGYPPTSGDSITGGTPPTLTGQIKNLDSTLLGWTTALSAGDILAFNVSGVTMGRRVTLVLSMEK